MHLKHDNTLILDFNLNIYFMLKILRSNEIFLDYHFKKWDCDYLFQKL